VSHASASSPPQPPRVDCAVDCAIQATPIDSARLRRELPELPGCGGYAAFEGLVRNVNDGRRVTRLDYEAYDELALKEMRRICEEALERFGLQFARAYHRRGSLAIGDVAVAIQVLTGHRGEAFAGCRYVIDQIKERVPIWKKEFYEDGTTEWTRCHHVHGARQGDAQTREPDGHAHHRHDR
jgi:molybdopterin synthase catalytic subunit